MIETTTNKVVYVVARNPVFAYPYPFFSASDIHCYLYDGETETELVRGTDFAVEVKDSYADGAAITLLGTLVSGRKLTITRELPLTQDVNLPEYGKIPTTALEAQLDKCIMITQQLKELVSRTLSLPHGMEEYDKDEFYNQYRKLINNVEIWAEESKTGAENAATSANSAEAASERASGIASSINGYVDAAYTSKRESAASALEASLSLAELREISNRASLNLVTLLFGDWGDEGIYISYDDWTDAESLSSVDKKLTAHDSSPSAHAGLFVSKAPLASPTFTGTVIVPNVNVSDYSSRAVNSKFVTDFIGTGLVPAGVVTAYAGSGNVPYGWFKCDGSAKSRTTYAKLFAAIGTTYGAGDGSTTFNVPDFRGKFLRGYLSGTSAEIGTEQAEGLPNITGGPLETEDNYAPSGAIYRSGTHQTSGERKQPRNTKYFDASRSNSIYGASAHVTPVNYAVLYIIKW